MRIIIDHRERKSFVIEELIALGVKCEVKHLPLADYIISKDLGIERKTVTDFVGSMINKRMIKQLVDLKANYKKPLLLIEGLSEEDLYSPSSHPNINKNAIKGMLLSIVLDIGVPIIFTDDYKDTASYLYLLLKREGSAPKGYGLAVSRKAYSLSDQQQIFIEGFPSVGPGLSKGLLKHFKSVGAIINASVKDLREVPKVGKKKAEILRKIIDSKYTKKV